MTRGLRGEPCEIECNGSCGGDVSGVGVGGVGVGGVGGECPVIAYQTMSVGILRIKNENNKSETNTNEQEAKVESKLVRTQSLGVTCEQT